MTKPIVFSYKEYEELKDKYEKLVLDYAHLKGELTNYEIRCRIAETDLEYYKANQESIESLKNVIDTQHDTIETYHKIVAYQQTEIDRLRGEWIPLIHDTYMTTNFPHERDGQWVIVTDGKSISIERIKKDAYDHFYPNGRWFELEDVIAWMPLPKPYKGGDTE